MKFEIRVVKLKETLETTHIYMSQNLISRLQEMTRFGRSTYL